MKKILTKNGMYDNKTDEIIRRGSTKDIEPNDNTDSNLLYAEILIIINNKFGNHFFLPNNPKQMIK